MAIAGGYVDDKVVRARKMLRDGMSLQEMAPALGYKEGSSVRMYLIRMGLPLPSIKGTRHRPSYSDDQKQVRSQKMKEWHANRKLRSG
jgi:hypothetical protein